jgi:DNA repair exonuclease SbcCD ATPase subunit
MQQTDLETIIVQERERLVSAALNGEFGDLERYYDPFEQRVMYAVQAAQRVSASVKQAAQRFFGKSVQFIQYCVSYIPSVKLVDDSNAGHGRDVQQHLEQLEELEEPTETYHPPQLRVVSPVEREMSKSASVSYSGRLYALIESLVRKKVARDIIPRTYAHFTRAEQTLSENAREIEKDIDTYSRKREKLLEQGLRIGRDLGQRESELAVLEKEEQALRDDFEAAKQLSQAHLANDRAYSDPKTSETAEQYGRLLPVIRQKMYDSQRRYTQLEQSIERDKIILAQITDEVRIINEGITAIESVYKTVQANKKDVIRERALLEQKTATYNTWVEALQFAQHIPQPIEVTPIIATMENSIRALKQKYGDTFGVHVLYGKERQVIEKTPGVM